MNTDMTNDYLQLGAEPKRYQNFINGSWSAGPERSSNINPSDCQKILGETAGADGAMVEAAVQAARQAQLSWAQTAMEQRADVLLAIGNELIARKQMLGELLASEEGKTLPEAIGEAERAGRFFQYYAGEVWRQGGDFADSVRPGVEVEVIREAVGTVLVITPWNFPLALPAWKIAPALAFGNSVVFKPAELTPACACALVAIMQRCGLPAGVVQLVLGAGATVGQQLLESQGIDAISFTGSLATGKRVAAAASARLCAFQLEMGSKNALVVADDADLDLAVACAVNGAFGSTGQKCTASSRILVHTAVYEQFLQRFIAASANLRVGPALDARSNIGPCVSAQQLHSNQDYLQLGQAEGAQLVYQGQLAADLPHGYYCAPAIFAETNNNMRINREEMFAPITCLQRYSELEQAVALCNDSEFGLTAGIITKSLRQANYFKRQVHSGCAMINLATAGTDYHVPFGGVKSSSFGAREQGRYAIDFYTKLKTVYSCAGSI